MFQNAHNVTFKMDFVLTVVLLIATGYTTADANCGDLTFYSREDWGARDPVCEEDMPIPVTYIFIHHTATSECDDFEECSVQMRAIQNLHIDSNGWCDIGYNFLIGGDGAVYTARGWDKVGAHTMGYNDIAVAFSLMGNFEVSPVPQNMLDTAQALIECATGEAGALEDLYSLHGHKDSRCTACPGVYLYDEISNWLYFNRLDVDFIC